MKVLLYLTALLWICIGIANYLDIAFVSGDINALFLLGGFIGLTAISLLGIGYLRIKLSLPRWLAVTASSVSVILIMLPGLVFVLAAVLGSVVPFDSAPTSYGIGNDLRCQAQVYGGATVAFNRVDILLFRDLYLGLERKIAHQSWIDPGLEKISLENECVKFANSHAKNLH